MPKGDFKLDKIELSLSVSKEEYREKMGKLEDKLSELQRKAKELKIPVIIVFEGWGAAGKGTLINELILPLDPRGFNVYTMNTLNEEESLKPFLWRYWVRTPTRGRFAIFDRSWYRRVHVERVDRNIEGEELSNTFEDIESFERQLADDGSIIIKFYLHISKKEQKERFKKLEKNPATAWRVTEADWKHHEQYDEYIPVVERMINETHSEYAPWVIIEAEDRRFAAVKVFASLVETLEEAIHKKDREAVSEVKRLEEERKGNGKYSNTLPLLNEVSLDKCITKAEYRKKLKTYQDRIRELEHEMYRKRKPVVVVYEGWDAAGKGGNIKRLTEKMDPRGYEVIPISAPSDVEKAHHYLWRFWKEMPKAGHMAIFDRSWYGRVMVERIEGFCSEEEWKRAYGEINDMEKQLSNFGVVVIKFWLHIDREEQLKRFEERQQDPKKQWKITDEDWRNREKWDLYEKAVDEMLQKTNTDYAPWTIVESNDKLYARIKVLETVIDRLERALKD